ncbi:unnamed protein product [Larinioides sclopetarius]|uniref:Uncharacterized protein n=1 Tax=Larinioides sclopetarius TaxID=280406 RepID=A0AAV1ZRR8_9ARAC
MTKLVILSFKRRVLHEISRKCLKRQHHCQLVSFLMDPFYENRKQQLLHIQIFTARWFKYSKKATMCSINSR